MNQPEPSAEVIEAAAEAMALSTGLTSWADLPSDEQNYYRELARAALGVGGHAVTEPSAEVIEAAHGVIGAYQRWVVARTRDFSGNEEAEADAAIVALEAALNAAGAAWRAEQVDTKAWGQKVQGRCPACGAQSLFLGDHGYVTCAIPECPKPHAAVSLLNQGLFATDVDADVRALVVWTRHKMSGNAHSPYAGCPVCDAGRAALAKFEEV